jgi:hypothetical protein
MKNSEALKIALAGLGILILLVSTLYAIPQTINYQGLLEEDGSPVDGTRDITFRIYDSSESGSILWEEEQTVTLSGGVFSVLLGSTEPIPTSVFDGGRRWLSVSIEEEPEILPRGELVSVGYAFFSGNADSAGHALTADQATDAETAQEAVNADKLDNLDSSKFSGVSHTHDSRYYRQDLLNTSDGTPPNEGSNRVHWNILTGLPDGFADGVDDTGEGPTDHGQLVGLLDNDHPQYALKDSLKMTDGTPPNQGRNMVHWSILTGVPEDFADETDDITTDAGDIVTGTMAPERVDGVAVVSDDSRLLTTGQKNQLTGGGVTTLHAHDASQIVSGTMAPERIAGVAIVSTDDRLLTSAEKAELTGGDTTSLHVHIEAGDISAVTAGEGLAGGGTTDSVEISHAEDASSLPLAHHTPPVLAYERLDTFSTASASPTVVVSDSLVVPDSGFIFVSFSATQKLDVTVIPDPPYVVARRYIADYGVSVDQPSTLQYSVRSSILETEVWFAGLYVPTKAVAGTAVFKVTTPGKHIVYFLTEVAYDIDSGARSVLSDISLSAIFIEHDSASMQGAMLLSGGRQRASAQAPVGR